MDIFFMVVFIVFLIGLFVYIMRSGFLDCVYNGFWSIFCKIKWEEENEFLDMFLFELVGFWYVGILFSFLFVMLFSILCMFL